MGVIPYELLVPLGQLKALNLSGNHLVNVSMQILHPVVSLEVSRKALKQLLNCQNLSICAEKNVKSLGLLPSI